MGNFSVKPQQLKSTANQLSEQEMKLFRIWFEIKCVDVQIRLFSQMNMQRIFDKVLLDITEEKNKINILKNNLLEIADIYSQCEFGLMNTEFFKSSDGYKYNPAFDEDGLYGGNQSDPKNLAESKELKNIVRKYYPNKTQKEISEYLVKLESEGCGYVALVNTVFAQYVGKQDEFRETFGFSMYKENGELNYEALVTDLYAATDNHNYSRFKGDVINDNEDDSNTVGYGTNRDSRKYRFELYMKEHGIDAKVDNNIGKVTANNYDSISKKGDIIVGVHPCILYDEDGNKVVNINGGHAMTVTGYTADGMLIVSSWGEKYYIKPDSKEYDRMQFQRIEY